MKRSLSRVFSFVLCLAMLITMSVFPIPAICGYRREAASRFTDHDADHAYFQGDNISFSYNTGTTTSVAINTPVVAELYRIGNDTTAIPLLTDWDSEVKRVACDTSTANTNLRIQAKSSIA